VLFLVGLDDYDSHFGGCTTYVAYRLINELSKEGIRVVPLPCLVRLNPYLPFKTRGNAAVKIIVSTNKYESARDLLDHIYSIVDRYRERRGKADPGLAVLSIDESYSDKAKTLYKVYRRAVSDIVVMDQIDRIRERLGIETRGGRGRTGAVACLGFVPDIDSTFELLVYGDPSLKKVIDINIEEIEHIDELFMLYTFANVDRENEQILLFPSGPDPVIYGVRGDSPLHVIFMSSIMYDKIGMGLEGWLLFRTNQATGAHLHYSDNRVRTFNPYRSILSIRRTSRTEDRHLVAYTEDYVHIFVYRHIGEPSKLIERNMGDIVEVWGGLRVKDGDYFIYVEGCRKLSERAVSIQNPRCPICGSSLKSLGRGKGFFCKKCKIKVFNVYRILRENVSGDNRLFSLPPISEFRHLMKPVSRIGIERFSHMFNDEDIPLWIL